MVCVNCTNIFALCHSAASRQEAEQMERVVKPLLDSHIQVLLLELLSVLQLLRQAHAVAHATLCSANLALSDMHASAVRYSCKRTQYAVCVP